MKRCLSLISLALLAVCGARAQMPTYLDTFVVKIKPERRADFDAISKKVSDANRKARGDFWTAMEIVYGEGNMVMFTSPRKNFADVEHGMQVFESALTEVYGPGAAKKMEQDFNATLVSSRSELRFRRPDLSFNAPADEDALNKMIGEARWIRIQTVRVRPGHQPDFEEQTREIKAVYEKSNANWTVMVSQGAAGQTGPTYYLSALQPSLAAFDNAPDLRKMMGEESFAAWMKRNTEIVASNETILAHVLPEISNMPEAVMKAAPEFWKPKPAGTAKPKALAIVKEGQK